MTACRTCQIARYGGPPCPAHVYAKQERRRIQAEYAEAACELAGRLEQTPGEKVTAEKVYEAAARNDRDEVERLTLQAIDRSQRRSQATRRDLDQAAAIQDRRALEHRLKSFEEAFDAIKEVVRRR